MSQTQYLITTKSITDKHGADQHRGGDHLPHSRVHSALPKRDTAPDGSGIMWPNSVVITLNFIISGPEVMLDSRN